MANFKILFGLLPKTEKIEQTEKALIQEYNDLNAFAESDELKHFVELETYVNSPEFASEKQAIESEKYPGSEEQQKEQQYLQLKKSANVKNYYKAKNSPDLKKFKDIQASGKLEKTAELQEFVASAEFSAKKSELSPKEFKASDEHAKELELKKLQSSSEIKFYNKYSQKPIYTNFVNMDGGTEIETYEELEQYVATEEFINRKKYLLLSPAKKFQQSELFTKQQEYLTLKKSEKIVWYYKLKDSNKYDELKAWNITFEDDFDSDKLDTSKWMTNHYWGEVMLQEKYSMENEKHMLNDNNITLGNSICTINTKKEKNKGKLWVQPKKLPGTEIITPVGFIEKEFDYSSGLISTANSFRQKHGRFKAKVRINQPCGVIHSFWMLAEQIVPHIDVFKFDKKSLFAGLFWGDLSNNSKFQKFISKIAGSNLNSKFHIFELDWTSDKITWKINGEVVASASQGLPENPMYIAFSSSVQDENIGALPSKLEIDWVKCYEKAVPA